NRAAACRVDNPPSTAAITRSRKSMLNGLPIRISPPMQDESNDKPTQPGIPSDSQFREDALENCRWTRCRTIDGPELRGGCRRAGRTAELFDFLGQGFAHDGLLQDRIVAEAAVETLGAVACHEDERNAAGRQHLGH